MTDENTFCNVIPFHKRIQTDNCISMCIQPAWSNSVSSQLANLAPLLSSLLPFHLAVTKMWSQLPANWQKNFENCQDDKLWWCAQSSGSVTASNALVHERSAIFVQMQPQCSTQSRHAPQILKIFLTEECIRYILPFNRNWPSFNLKQGCTNFTKSGSHFKILGARRVT